jgi:energy-coupling factor transporter ATP-binding protein EcfA2
MAVSIERICLSWFRGAAADGTLTCGSKSVVVYGANGSGKSTFADAVEYLVRRRIRHLAHEYSGSRQEKGIRNTATAENAPSKIRIELEAGQFIHAEIDGAGNPHFASNPPGLGEEVQGWELASLILRQDEVAEFIHSTKGDKYSALLPLLGLAELEQAAENLHRLEDAVRRRGALEQNRVRLDQLREAGNRIIPGFTEVAVEGRLTELAQRYLEYAPEDLLELASALSLEIERRIQMVEPAARRYLLIQQIQHEALDDKSRAMLDAEAAARGQMDALLDSRISVLLSASSFAESAVTEEEVRCPACGRPIRSAELAKHVKSELESLGAARSFRDAAISARRALATGIETVLKSADELDTWLGSEGHEDCRSAIARLRSATLPTADREWPTDVLDLLGDVIPAITSTMDRAVEQVPASTTQLVADKQVADFASSLPVISSLEQEVSRVAGIAATVASAKDAVRTRIRRRTTEIIQDISSEVQRLWSKIHPGEPITDVHLYVPEEADKAIDVGLRFFETDQPSPRLTLSEGHRNSLGLCIFLALARLHPAQRPIVLDDVVSSMDREHRGPLSQVLIDEFSDRQVLLFTHDREWFAELRAVLPASNWRFLALRPWQTPEQGLQWAQSLETFDDARVLLGVSPEAAGNRARSIMDTQLAVIAERLKVEMPYARGDRNDHRTCVEFLNAIISQGSQRFKIRAESVYVPFSDAIAEWRNVCAALITRANRASHTGSLTEFEARELIDACESTLARFRCISCNDPVWISDQAGRERLQCPCGQLRWTYS